MPRIVMQEDLVVNASFHLASADIQRGMGGGRDLILPKFCHRRVLQTYHQVSVRKHGVNSCGRANMAHSV